MEKKIIIHGPGNFRPADLPQNPGRVARPDKTGKLKQTKYLDIISTFDIETTSTEVNGEKIAFIYHWQFYIAGHVYRGRTWNEFINVLDYLNILYKGSFLVVYVHNLAFEFSHFARVIGPWKTVFCTNNRTPIKAIPENYNIEFRDSYTLSGLPLSALPTKTKKLTGDLDYSKIRLPITPMTAQEIRYCINDVVVLAEYIETKLKEDNLATIPMTRTGYVRRDVRARMKRAKELPKNLIMTPDQYKRLRKIYAGGFTHAAAYASGKLFQKVRSLDITSSYPTVLCAEYYPMSNFNPYTPTDRADLKRCLNEYACMLTARFYGLRERGDAPDHIISASKCTYLTNAQQDNGRVVSADFVELELTEIDFFDILEFYTADEIRVDNLEIAYKARLPRSLAETILYYYAQKTTLKGLRGPLDDGSDAETMYAKYKEFVNAIYGCFVTDPCKPEITFSDEWTKTEPNIDEIITKFNESSGRWCYYPWGVWCTAYARHNLFLMMRRCGFDFLYSDTDSLKILNYETHKADFDKYNEIITERLTAACHDLGIDPALVAPKNRRGKLCPLGIWTDEGEYNRFKTLGAKRYLTSRAFDGPEYDLSPTVAGAPKRALKRFLKASENPFDLFEDGLTLSPEVSGKNCHTYISAEGYYTVTDYTGRTDTIEVFRDACHIAPTSVTLSLSEEYAIYLALLESDGNERFFENRD